MIRVRLDDRTVTSPRGGGHAAEVLPVLVPIIETANRHITPASCMSVVEFTEGGHHLELFLVVPASDKSADAHNQRLFRENRNLHIDGRIDHVAVYRPPLARPRARELGNGDASLIGSHSVRPLCAEIRAVAKPFPGRQSANCVTGFWSHVNRKQAEENSLSRMTKRRQPVGAVHEHVVADAHVTMPLNGVVVATENISRLWRRRFPRQAADVHAGQIVGGECGEAGVRQRGAVMDEIDVMVARPRTRKGRHEQLRAPHASAKAMLNVQP